MDRTQPSGGRLLGTLLLLTSCYVAGIGNPLCTGSSPSEPDEVGREQAQRDGAKRVADAGPPVVVKPPPVYPDYQGHPDDERPVRQSLGEPERLEHYYEQLLLAERKVPGAVARAGQWGDSVMGGDGMTEQTRQLLQARFGVSGHGYHAVGKYNRFYRHRNINFKERVAWKSCMVIYKCRDDGRYGYGGVVSISSGGARSWWGTTEDEGFGHTASRFQVLYGTHERGGKFEVRIDGEKVRTIDTRAAALGDGIYTVELEDAPHEFEVVAKGDGEVRTYGALFERDVPGAIWDEMALVGSMTQRLDYQDPDHLAAQLKLRELDLFVFLFGGNDVSRERRDLKDTMAPYEEQYNRVVDKFRTAKPDANCVIMALIDHVEKVNGRIVTREIMPRLVASQRKVAEENGCAFFDTFAAMGGDGSFVKWLEAKPRLASKDLHHPTVRGQRRIGTMLYEALMQGYAEYRRSKAGKPLPEHLRAQWELGKSPESGELPTSPGPASPAAVAPN